MRPHSGRDIQQVILRVVSPCQDQTLQAPWEAFQGWEDCHWVLLLVDHWVSRACLNQGYQACQTHWLLPPWVSMKEWTLSWRKGSNAVFRCLCCHDARHQGVQAHQGTVSHSHPWLHCCFCGHHWGQFQGGAQMMKEEEEAYHRRPQRDHHRSYRLHQTPGMKKRFEFTAVQLRWIYNAFVQYFKPCIYCTNSNSHSLFSSPGSMEIQITCFY